MSPQILTVSILFFAKDCVMLCKHKGEETVPALKELQSTGKQRQGKKQS